MRILFNGNRNYKSSFFGNVTMYNILGKSDYVFAET